MKRCPKCNRLFDENSLKFCRSDGSVLVTGSITEANTIFFSGAQPLAQTPPKPLPDTPSSIAVLPFRNLTPDPANEYFGVGLADELVHSLSRIEHLKVVGGTAAVSFKGKDVDVRELGKTLNVDMVLEGSIRRSKNKMRITVQLVSASSGFHVWSERYDRQLSETFDVKGDIALAVVKALEVTLRGPERTVLIS